MVIGYVCSWCICERDAGVVAELLLVTKLPDLSALP